MELILGAILGLGVGFACVLLYRKGVSDGMGMVEGEKPAPVSFPMFAEKEEKEDKLSLESQYQSFMNFQPKYTEERHAE